MSSDIANPLPRTPVTVLTGFLGSGKTTLLNRILSEHHGQRIAVIENEFGEIGIDQDIVINADEEILEMNNGCICCTVRGDLLRILGRLQERRDRFDRVVIETTGMANPGPVAQTFIVDEDIAKHYELDGIVTLVDARHAPQHFDTTDEFMAQVGFADRIVLNKTDLVSPAEADTLVSRLRRLNAMADILPAHMSNVALDRVLNIGGFNLNRALEVNPGFLEPEYPFEWLGVYDLPAGLLRLSLQPGPDPAMTVLLVPLAAMEIGEPATLAEAHFTTFSDAAQAFAPGATLAADGRPQDLLVSGTGASEYTLLIPAMGRYALFTQHTPEEFDLTLEAEDGQRLQPSQARYFNAAHSHDDTVSSVAFELPGDLEAARLNAWLSVLLQEEGANLFRMKGILSLYGEPARVIFQGVHMLFDYQLGTPWGDEPRVSRLVFIGRNLNPDYLEGALALCRISNRSSVAD